MKKLISVLLSITLAALSFSSLALSADTAEAAQKGRSYVIWDANPRNVSEEDGANAYPTADYEWSFGKERIQGTSKVKYDEDTPYYLLEFSSEFDHDKVLVENGFMCNNGGSNATAGNISSGYMGWLQYPEILRAIKDYVYVSYDVYVEDEQGRDITLTISPMHQYMDAWEKDPQSNCGIFDRFTVTEKNEWVSRSVQINSIADAASTADRWTQGDVFFQVSGLDGAALTVKIRNFRLEVKESDYENINTALSYVENIDNKKNFTTYFWSDTETLPDLPKTSGGKNDYFAILAAFDKGSDYSTNRNDVTVTGGENGTVSDNQTGIYAGETVTVTATPNEGYEAAVSAKDGNGDVVAMTDNGDGTYSFIMPASPVNVTVSFVENISYVIWDADPTKVSTEDGASAKPNVDDWEEALRPSGTAVVDYSENVPSFKLTTGFYYNKGVSFRSGTTMYGQNNTPIAFTGWMNHRDVFQAIAPYVYISYDVYVEDAQNRNAHIKMTAMPNDAKAWEKDAFQEFGTLDNFDGIPANQWVSRTAKIGSINDGNKNWSQGFVAVSLEWFPDCDEEANMTFKIRNLKLTVNESDKDAINAALARIEGIDTKNWFTGTSDGSETDWRFPTAGDSLDYFAGLTAFDKSSSFSTNRETGDANNDGNVDVLDFVRVKKFAADNSVRVNYAACDCDRDGVFTPAAELIALRKALMGIAG